MPNRWNKKKRKVKKTKSGLYKYKDIKKEMVDGKKVRTVTKGYAYPSGVEGSYSGSEITTSKTRGGGTTTSSQAYGGTDKPDPGYKWQPLKKGGKIRDIFKEQYD